MRRDLVRFTPLALACVLAVLWFAFRRVRAVVLPLVTVILAVVWTLGVMAPDRHRRSRLGTFMLPPLLLVVGSAQAMHVIAAYYEQVRARRPRAERWPQAVHAGLGAAADLRRHDGGRLRRADHQPHRRDARSRA